MLVRVFYLYVQFILDIPEFYKKLFEDDDNCTVKTGFYFDEIQTFKNLIVL